jgi:hypothetical protein
MLNRNEHAMRRARSCTSPRATLALLLLALLGGPLARAQEAGHGGVSAAELAKANNPLADANAINFQNYFMPSLQGLPSASVNAFSCGR